MNDKDRFDAFKALADFRLARFKIRTDAEWKISLALWAALAIAPISVSIKPNLYVLAILFIVLVLAYAFLWSGQIWIRNQEDQQNAFYYMSHAESLILPEEKIQERPERNRVLFDKKNWKLFWSLQGSWGAWFQILTTAFFAGVSFWLFYLK